MPVQDFPGPVVQPPGNAARQQSHPWALCSGLRPNSISRSDRDRIYRIEELPRRGRRRRELPQIGQFADPAAPFRPTGAISTTNAASYLTVLHVGCVGGSWITPSDVPAAHDWARITKLATAASRL